MEERAAIRFLVFAAIASVSSAERHAIDKLSREFRTAEERQSIDGVIREVRADLQPSSNSVLANDFLVGVSQTIDLENGEVRQNRSLLRWDTPQWSETLSSQGWMHAVYSQAAYQGGPPDPLWGPTKRFHPSKVTHIHTVPPVPRGRRRHHPRNISRWKEWRGFWKSPWHKLAALLSCTLLLLLFDQYVITLIIRFLQPFVWTALGLAFNAYIIVAFSKEDATEWFNGYAYEWMFQVDNLFIFHVIFRRYDVPDHLVNRALFACLVGQLTTRFMYYLGLAHVIRSISLIHYMAGAFLVYAGGMAIYKPHATVPNSSGADDGAGPLVRGLRLLGIPIVSTWAEGQDRFFVKMGGKLCATPLLQVVICLIAADLFLGADCAIVKIEEVSGPFWNISSSALALFGLRSSYRFVADMADTLVYIQYGIGVVLVFVGMELACMDFVNLGSFTSLVVIMFIMAFATLWSLLTLCYRQKRAK